MYHRLRNDGSILLLVCPLCWFISTPAGAELTRHVWRDVGGSDLKALTRLEAYPFSPDEEQTLPVFEAPAEDGDDFGARVFGYLVPSVSGAYTFSIAGDDECELRLSWDDQPSGRRLIARVPGYTSPREWEKYPEQVSDPVRLEAGRRYFIEALHKEGGGGDSMAVAWRTPGGGSWDVIGERFLQPWRQGKVRADPDTPVQARVRDAFPGLRFQQPLGIHVPPGGTNELFIIEKEGRIYHIPDLSVPEKDLFLDLSDVVSTGGEQGLLGMACHPGFRRNGVFFVFYTCMDGGTRYDRLSRFRVDSGNPHRADRGSEQPMINQEDDASNHNGGDLHFGPDGYLYVSLGDEGSGNDALDNSQRIDKDFFSAIMRIDVEGRPENLWPHPHPAIVPARNSPAFYRVPADNPYVGTTRFNGKPIDASSVRTEFWAVGLRNAWRFSFDPLTGDMYTGDVGQNTREEINRIEKGGNYGWAYEEGFVDGPKKRHAPPGFKGIEPLWDYPRDKGISVTGGVVYRGNASSPMYGAYVFCDYATGYIWAYREINGAARVDQVARQSGIAGFGVDPRNGDVLMANLHSGVIHRLEPVRRLHVPE